MGVRVADCVSAEGPPVPGAVGFLDLPEQTGDSESHFSSVELRRPALLSSTLPSCPNNPTLESSGPLQFYAQGLPEISRCPHPFPPEMGGGNFIFKFAKLKSLSRKRAWVLN